MPLKDIINTINKEANGQIAEIVKQAHAKSVQIKQEYQQKIDQAKAKVLKQTQVQADKEKQQARIKFEAETKSAVLQKKQNILDEVYKKALDKLSSMSDDQALKLLVKLLENCPNPEHSGEAKVIPAKGKEALIKIALEKVQRLYKCSSDSVDAKGGFIFSSENLEIDNTFDSLVKEIRHETEIQIDKMLFG